MRASPDIRALLSLSLARCLAAMFALTALFCGLMKVALF